MVWGWERSFGWFKSYISGTDYNHCRFFTWLISWCLLFMNQAGGVGVCPVMIEVVFFMHFFFYCFDENWQKDSFIQEKKKEVIGDWLAGRGGDHGVDNTQDGFVDWHVLPELVTLLKRFVREIVVWDEWESEAGITSRNIDDFSERKVLDYLVVLPYLRFPSIHTWVFRASKSFRTSTSLLTTPWELREP